MDSPRVIDYQRLYRRTSITIDVLCLVGFPLVLGILVNYVLGIGTLVFLTVIIVLRRRFLDEKAEKIVLGSALNLGYPADGATGSPTDGKPIRIMMLAAVLVTAIPIVSLVIHLTSGEGFSIWPIGCIAAIWFGVGMTAFGHRLGHR